MENEQPQQDTTPAQPVEQTPGQQDRPEPATPAHEEADRASGQETVDDEEPGDAQLPEEFQDQVSDQPAQPDEVDQSDGDANGA